MERRSQRAFLSPEDAYHIRTNTITNMKPSSESQLAEAYLELFGTRSPPPTKTTLTSSALTPHSKSIDRPEDNVHGLQQQARGRRYSEQDIKTRSARASIAAQKHNSTGSYPLYSPSSLPTGFSSTPPFLPYGVSRSMENPRLYPRPQSAGSSITSRSSFESRFESRTKSPLSITSSIDYGSSRTSFDSTYSEASSKDGLTVSRPAIRPMAHPGARRMVTEPIVPTLGKHGAGGEDGQQVRTLMTPQRLANGNNSYSAYGMRYTQRTPGDGFKKLPKEILLVILTQLKKVHLDVGSLSCSTCCMRDLTNLGLSCKKWWGAAQIALYEDIQLNGSDSILHTKKKFKMKYGTRLTLLRRTLRGRPDLAEYVKSLKVPAIPDAAKSKKEQDEYLELVASVIMACPNLERLPGLYPTYNHDFTRLDHALSTRKKLVEKVWIVNPSPFQRQHRYQLSEDAEHLTPVMSPAQLLPEQYMTFKAHHSNWSNLQTLFLHCNPGGTIDSALFVDIFHSLPSLVNLHVSNFPASSFHDATLLSLPSLKSLRLENLPGITSSGLSSYASPSRTDDLTSLSLISIQLRSLPVLTRLFSHLKSLAQFTISQAPSPTLPTGEEIYLHPYLASSTLQYLHWEFTNPDNDKATQILSTAISFNGFPSLKTIRAPTDHDGLLQRLCKPKERIELPGDRYRNLNMAGNPVFSQTQSLPSLSPTRSTFSGHGHSGSINSNSTKSPTQSAFSLNFDHLSNSSDEFVSREKGMSLVTARRMAQHRIDTAMTQPKFHIIIWDESGEFLERFALGGFLGSLQSQITYTLKPDVDGMDEAVISIDGPGGLLDKGEETNARDGCTGSWNLDAGTRVKGANKGKDRWWHSERGRWKDIPLQKLF
ncbi:uncharacterized protein LY89DRAFT_631101 [Mollisia scopiformis]|uniref:F-box domain-containing protein n=1 Tax=Mollisia scopiformis TaxID=149040 RepID=A0A132B789_MOLSC|nr:uncharacterized protein LY89DRAFT_631101 [Mollisia scopiformis]KUJ07547.1 hypothetical protein LY89DRAFT_631101 [Mollisia scopiformis]